MRPRVCSSDSMAAEASHTYDMTFTRSTSSSNSILLSTTASTFTSTAESLSTYPSSSFLAAESVETALTAVGEAEVWSARSIQAPKWEEVMWFSTR